MLEVYRALVRRAGDREFIDDLVDREETPGVNAAVQALVESGLAARRGRFAWALRPDGEDEIDLAGLEAHRAHATAKLNSMQSYAESATCLRARVLDYFGETEGPRSCGNCGPCLAPTQRREVDNEAPLFLELRALRRRLAEEEGVPPYVIFSDATLHDMVEQRPTTEAGLLQVRGVGRVKAERYGRAFLAVIASQEGTPPPPAEAERTPAPREPGHPLVTPRAGTNLPPTAQRTLELHHEGLTIDEIAVRRGFKAQTIAQHLARFVEQGQIEDVRPWVSDAELAGIRRAAAGRPIAALRPLREALDGDLSYDQLTIARAYLNREIRDSG